MADELISYSEDKSLKKKDSNSGMVVRRISEEDITHYFIDYHPIKQSKLNYLMKLLTICATLSITLITLSLGISLIFNIDLNLSRIFHSELTPDINVSVPPIQIPAVLNTIGYKTTVVVYNDNKYTRIKNLSGNMTAVIQAPDGLLFVEPLKEIILAKAIDIRKNYFGANSFALIYPLSDEHQKKNQSYSDMFNNETRSYTCLNCDTVY